MRFHFNLYIGIVVLLISCNYKIEEEFPVKYSFFVAGHTYGTPGYPTGGLYAPFIDKFYLLNDNENIKFGVFTGDIVISGTEELWDKVDEDLNKLKMPVYFAPGNHDMSNRQLFEQRYGPTYYSFLFEKDAFIVLDPNIDNWNISGSQLIFLDSVVNSLSDTIKNVFIFQHQLLWVEKDNVFKNIRLNSTSGRAEEINFWTEVIPLVQDMPQKVVFFAGDLGAGSWSDDFMYYEIGKVTFIATGMGEGKGDNFIIVDILEDNSVEYHLISLNTDDISDMGKLEDFELP